MPICKYYEQGTCRYGASCRFDHIDRYSAQGRGGYQNGFNSNRGGYNAFNQHSSRGGSSQTNGRGNSSQRGGAQQGDTRGSAKTAWTVDPAIIEQDLKKERPVWPFSCYAPKNDAPRQLIEGKLELSSEEMRLEAYKLEAQGKNAEVLQIESAAAAEMQSIIQHILSDVRGAIKYVADGADIHPNRQDIENGLIADTASAPFRKQSAPQANPFGQPSAPAAGPFGQASAAKPNPFGQSSAAPANPFGQANGTGPFAAATRPSPFGQPSVSPFSNASTQPAIKPNPFGTAQAPPPASGFGQPSAIGSQSKPNPFGQPSSSPFAAATSPSPFSQAVQPAANPFGQSSSTGMDTSEPSVARPNPFGSPAPPSQAQQAQTQPNPFGQPSQVGGSKPNPFGVSIQQPQSQQSFNPPTGPKANPFGQPRAPSQAPNPFGGNQPAANNPFGQNQSSANAASLSQRMPASTGSSGALQSKIIFDKGIPTQPLVDDPPPDMYGANEETFQHAYDYAKQTGNFENGLIPMLPPKTSWITYNNL